MTISQIFTIYWPVFASIGGGIISVLTIWTKLNNKVLILRGDLAETEKNLAKIEGRVDTMQPDLGTIKTDIAVMKNTLEFIKGAIAQTSSPVTINK